MSRHPPVTILGWVTIAGAVLFYFLGRQLGWIEFMAVACGLGLVLLIAVPFVVGGDPLSLSREVEPERVEVGGVATSVLTIENDGKRPSAPRTVDDTIGSTVRSIDVPALAPGDRAQAVSSLPTGTRGILKVGPAIIGKVDPLGLLRRDLGRSEVAELKVHPRFVALAPLRSGFVKDLEGPTFDNSPAGDIAFHAVREYVPGDDVRHIHWMSTARAGTLMVRHYVDNRRPYLAAVVDPDPVAMTADLFERALEAAASLTVSAAVDGRPIAVWVGEQEVQTVRAPATEQVALERMCVSAQETDVDLVELYELARSIDRGSSALVLLAGQRSAEELLPVAAAARRHGSAVIFRFVPDGTPSISLPNARVFDCSSLDHFSAAWNGLAL